MKRRKRETTFDQLSKKMAPSLSLTTSIVVTNRHGTSGASLLKRINNNNERIFNIRLAAVSPPLATFIQKTVAQSC